MRTISTILFIFITNYFYGQISQNYFYRNGKKFLKPVKYILYNPKVDNINETKTGKIFIIAGESFSHIKDKNKIDTLDIKSLEKISLSKPNLLSNEEYRYHKELNQTKHPDKNFKFPMPLTKNHTYFKIFVLEIKENNLIKYETIWTYIGSSGFNLNNE